MSRKISVLTIMYRPGYLDSMTQCLREQTFKDFEWILVDDLWEQRKDILREYVGNSLNLKHIPPREVRPYSCSAMAVNTGLIHAEGELIYFMNDYMYLHPRVLERHWEIYSKYGPKVLISGPLIDAIVASGKSVWAGAPAMPIQIKNEEGNIITYPELTPPIPFPLKDNFEEPTPDNLISIFREPFQPTWPKTFPPDWRLGHISKFSIDKNLCENDNPNWFWGRNDSAPLKALLDINGMDEALDGRRGGADADLGARLKAYGCRLLVDREVPCYILPHPVWKRANISEKDFVRRVAEKRKSQPIPNDYSLRVEGEKFLAREKLLKRHPETYNRVYGHCLNIEVATRNLLDIKAFLDKAEVKFWLMHGTFLGAYRDGCLMPWDGDTDLGVYREDFPRLLNYCKDEFYKMGFDFGFDPGIASLWRDGENTDFCPFQLVGNERVWLKFRYPAEAFETLNTVRLLGTTWRILNNPERWLAYSYGNDWRTPIKGRNNQDGPAGLRPYGGWHH